MRWPNFESLRRDLAIGNFWTEPISLPEGLSPPEQPPSLPAAPQRLETVVLPTATGNPAPLLAQNRQRNQEAKQNLYPAPQLQIGTGLRIHT